MLKFIKNIMSKKNNNNVYIDAELDYAKNRQHGINVRNCWRYSDEISNMMQYHVLNKIKELELKRKIREGKKVKVCFLLDTIAKFSSKSVYQIMENSELFEPFILLGDVFEELLCKDEEWNKYIKDLDTLKEKGYKVFSLYDDNRNYIPIETFKPDIVFVTAPYLEYLSSMHLSNIYLNVNYLVCNLSYGYNISNSYIYHHNNRRINSSWKHFVFTREDYTELMRFSRDCGINAVLTGYPKMDDYSKPIENCVIPEKINNGNPIVIYAPHWTIVHDWEPNDLGTFNLYYKYFLNLVKQYKNINFVFKPHPSLYLNLSDNGIMSVEEFNNYIKEWDSQPNGLYVSDGEYIDLFRKSSLMITDSVSFIGEYLPSENPCMYLVKPSRDKKTYFDGFSNLGRKILNQYYLCHDESEIEKYFKMIMVENIDPTKEERIKIKDEFLVNVGCAGQKIVDYLTDILQDDNDVKI